MEISTKKNKTVTNSTNNISADISMNGQKLEEVISFEHLGATLGTKMVPAHQKYASGLQINFASKFKLYNFLVTSIFLYGCET